MNCKKCKNEIPEGSLFCNWCGEKQLRSRKKKGAELKVPKAVQMTSGNWFIRLRIDGQNVNITAPTERECIEQARAAKAGLLEIRKTQEKKTLLAAMEEYLKVHSEVLSPSTLRGYTGIKNNRFLEYHEVDINTFAGWQKMVNKEARNVAPKTVKNAWGFVSAVLRYNKVDVPEISVPQIPPNELAWLNKAQIPVFLEAVKDTPVELAALFALHSLRRSELLTLTPSKISDGKITVAGAIVASPENKFVSKDTNKSNSSTRIVPIMIPRLQELIDASPNLPDEPYIKANPNTLYTQVQRVCKKANLPAVGLHGLRRSFASLAYSLGWGERKTMLIGGWSDFQTMHKMYIKLDSTDIDDAAETMSAFYEKVQNGN